MTEHDEPPIITRSRLIEDLKILGIGRGQDVMLHASVKAVGWVVGPDVILHAFREVLGPEGTLMMYVGWADGTYGMGSWPEARRRAYVQECPPFDPATSRSVIDWGILTEYLRTTPGARRSVNTEASVAAVGAKAAWLTESHPLDYGFGRGSPLEKLCEAGGEVLLLGTPLDTVTLLHYAESLADVPGKRAVRYRQPILVDGEKNWVEVEEYDTDRGVMRDFDEGNYFEEVVREYLAAGHGKAGLVGAARSYLLDARGLTAFAVAWMGRTFGGTAEAR